MLLNSKIEILKKYGLVDWQLLLVGFSARFISKNDVINYVVDYLQGYPDEKNNIIYLLAGAEYGDEL